MGIARVHSTSFEYITGCASVLLSKIDNHKCQNLNVFNYYTVTNS